MIWSFSLFFFSFFWTSTDQGKWVIFSLQFFPSASVSWEQSLCWFSWLRLQSHLQDASVCLESGPMCKINNKIIYFLCSVTKKSSSLHKCHLLIRFFLINISKVRRLLFHWNLAFSLQILLVFSRIWKSTLNNILRYRAAQIQKKKTPQTRCKTSYIERTTLHSLSCSEF